MHLRRIDLEQGELAIALAYGGSRLARGRQMHVVPGSLLQSLLLDGVEEPGCRSMIKRVWRHTRVVTEIDVYGMPLARSNSSSIIAYGKSLFVVGVNDFNQLVTSDRMTMAKARFQQLVNSNPARPVKLESRDFRLVSQYQRQELAGSLNVWHSTVWMQGPGHVWPWGPGRDEVHHQIRCRPLLRTCPSLPSI